MMFDDVPGIGGSTKLNLGRPDAFRIRALAKAVEKAAAKATMAGLAGAEMATAMASWTSFLWICSFIWQSKS